MTWRAISGRPSREAEDHHRNRVLESCFLSWKIQSQPLTAGEHLKLLGRREYDVWDQDTDEVGRCSLTLSNPR
jgi:hypothetical protein